MSVSEICPMADAAFEIGFCAYNMPVSLASPRGILAVGASDFLALERDTTSVVHVFDSDGDGIPESRRTLAEASGLNHGLAIYDNYIYASSDRAVYRWSFEDLTNHSSPLGDEELVIENINPDGMGGAPQGHKTRTLEFNEAGLLYVSVGSAGNVDEDSHRSRIRRFNISNGGFPLDFQEGEVFADGLRNEVGLAFDGYGDLWGVENGADNLHRSDLGGDISKDNPAEELNRFREEDAGKHWGYPYCWTEYNLPRRNGGGRGTVWAWPSFLDDGDITDEECRSDYVPPELSLQGHSAPLGIVFYKWKTEDERPQECNGVVPFPEAMNGYAFIAFHGSWNRKKPTGYKVIYIPFVEGEVRGPADLLAHKPPKAQWDDDFRPVDVDFDDCGRLLVSGDGDGSKMVRVEFSSTNQRKGTCPCMQTNNPVDLPSGGVTAKNAWLVLPICFFVILFSGTM